MFFNFGGHMYKLEIGYEHELTFQNKMNQTYLRNFAKALFTDFGKYAD